MGNCGDGERATPGALSNAPGAAGRKAQLGGRRGWPGRGRGGRRPFPCFLIGARAPEDRSLGISRAASEGIKVWLALGGGGLALAWRFLPAKLARAVLVMTVLAAGAVYARFNVETLTKRLDNYDLIHYYLNAKYFPELGYYDLYPACLVADKEQGPRWESGPTYMAAGEDGDHFAPIAGAYTRGREVKAAFTPERWKAFTHDFLYIQRQGKGLGADLWRQLIQDHGYNGTPAWTVEAMPIVNLVPVEYLKWVCYIDVLLLLLALMAIWWAYDADAALFVALFLLTTYSTRWPLIATALLRYDYLSGMLIAMCMLKKGQPLVAGLLTGWAGTLRIFPVVWMFGPAMKGVFGLAQGRVSKPLLVLAGGFLLAVAAVEAGSVVVLGVDAITIHTRDIRQHASAAELSSRRAGLALALPFRGDVEPKNITKVMRRQVEEQKHLRYGIAAAFLLALGWALRRADDDEVYAFGFAPFFALTTASYYYYVSRATLILAHAARRTSWRHATGLAMLFGIDAFSNWAEVNHPEHRVYLIGYLGWMLCGYFLVMLVWAGAESMRKSTVRSD